MILINTLILVEGVEDVKLLKDTILSPQAKVVSFDLESHRYLVSMGIEHDLIEDYYEETDYEKVDQLAIDLTRNWHMHEELRNFLRYNDINLGFITELEHSSFFLFNLRRMLGIMRTIQKENTKEIVVSSLGRFMGPFQTTKKIQIVEKESKIRSQVYSDTIEIPIQFKGKIISIKISRKNFLRLKNLLETFVYKIFSLKFSLRDSRQKKPILLLDFNPVMYEDLLNALSRYSHDILLLNQRRPAVWNLKSLRIIKNSHSKVIRLRDLWNSSLSHKIANEQRKVEEQLDHLWKKDNIFENIFCLEGHSFWNAIKKEFKESITRRSIETVERIILTEKLFDNIGIRSVLEWSHTGMEDKIIINEANKKNIPILLLQHAMYALDHKFEKFNPLITLLPSNGAKGAVWGDILKHYILEHNISPDEVVVTGSPRHDIFFRNRTQAMNDDTILIAGSPFIFGTLYGNETQAYDRLDDYTRRICQHIKKISDKRIIVKLHPGRTHYDIMPIVHEVDPSVPVYQNENIFELMEKCDAVIALNFSTVLLEAMILRKPTLVVFPERHNYEHEIPIRCKTVLTLSNPDNVESALDALLLNDAVRNELIERGEDFVNQYMAHQGDSCDFIAKLLKSK